MPRYRYEVCARAFGICEAETPKDAELQAISQAVDQIWDDALGVVFDATLTELSEGDTQR